ncbi:hypothetical protein [Bacillus alkalicellulosilyticus]|uniref:hypothetical protein n=1 Tax=Alkalihalobacterium alkalicellulosilyticum TaxID=1912214 RepID=UPI00099752B9|nr:hypothetical protein [Bacillus alkalicellulosilyticus]
MKKVILYFGVILYVLNILVLFLQTSHYSSEQLFQAIVFISASFLFYFTMAFLYFKNEKGKAVIPLILTVVGIVSIASAFLLA